jgi:hypothetical protein
VFVCLCYFGVIVGMNREIERLEQRVTRLEELVWLLITKEKEVLKEVKVSRGPDSTWGSGT